MKETIKKITTLKDPEKSSQRMINVVEEDHAYFTGNASYENRKSQGYYDADGENNNDQEAAQETFYTRGRGRYSGRGHWGSSLHRGQS